MGKVCYSCGAPLGSAEYNGPAENYCRYCTDSSGDLKSRMIVQQGIADWLKSWQPELDEEMALTRAALYMKAMPAWAEK